MTPAIRNVRRFLEDAVERNASEPYLIWAPDDLVITYEEFNERVDRAANVWHELGVRPGDRVTFMLDNCPEFLYAWLGLAKIGGVLVAVNTGFTKAEAAYPAAHSEARFALVGDEHLALFDEIATQVTSLERILTIGTAGETTAFPDLMMQVDARAPAIDVDGDATISLIYTSGTTGLPKGVMQTHNNYVLTGQAFPYWTRMRKGHRIYACLPLFHINSQTYSTMGAIGAEGAIVLSSRFSANRFWPEVRRHRVNVFSFIGAMTVILSKKEPEPTDKDNDVHVAYGVPALPPGIQDDIEERFGLRVISGFGMSETTFGLLEPLDGQRRPGSMGVPRHHPDLAVPRTQARILDDNGDEVPDGTIGELVLKNAAMMKGYFKEPEKTDETLAAGWLFTGDSAWRDSDGFYYFVDRKKDIVRRRGENVSSLEVEHVVSKHPAVLESAVIGVPSELTDEEILLYVVRHPDHRLEPAEIVEWCGQWLAPFKVPRFVEFVDDLPKTPTAKIEKYRLGDWPPAADRFDSQARVADHRQFPWW